MTETTVREIRTPTLEIAYEESGPADGPPVVLLHGFPDDVRAYDGVARSLAAAGLDRVEVTYKPLRSVVDPQFAVLQNAPLLHEEAGTNVLAEREFVRGDIEAENDGSTGAGGRFRFAAQRCPASGITGAHGVW